MTNYTKPLALTSQFSYCALPLRLDSYRGCGFSCTYCFARNRGGNVPSPAIAAAAPDFLRRKLDSALIKNERSSLVNQMLRQRVPLHFGGMSDGFQVVEHRKRISLQFLHAIDEHRYPTVISTRSPQIARHPYLDLIAKCRDFIMVQFSFCTIDDKVSREVEPNAPLPTDKLFAMAELSREGVAVTCRWQPFIKALPGSKEDFVEAVSRTGAVHLSFEHLKIGFWREIISKKSTVMRDALDDYRRRGAVRDGWEWVLASEQKVDDLVQVRRLCHRSGMSFGAADNEFLYLSDHFACCSAVDRFPAFGKFYRYQTSYALKKSIGTEIRFSEIQSEWRPEGSVDRHLNTKNGLRRRLGLRGDAESHLRYRWNHGKGPGAPLSFFGIEDTGEFDDQGMKIYSWGDSARSLIGLTVAPHPAVA